MTVHKFTIDFKGKKEPIEYEDDMPFGTFEKIIRECADMTDESKLVKNVQEYRKAILLNALVSAPFEITDEGLDKIGYKIIIKIAERVVDAYPLGEYLNQTMKPFEESPITNK
jgi:hypothetical protein